MNGRDAYGWTAQDRLLARKVARRYELTGNPFSRNWMREVHVARLVIAMGLVRFFEKLARLADDPTL